MTAIALMFLQGIFIVTFGMEGIRAHMEQARSKGGSDDLVEGMIERRWFYFEPRIAAGVAFPGLFIVSVAAVTDRRREAITEGDD